ncbi:MAG: hypothetical protein OXB92_15850 [Acidimicrobiaceae bacterium]|nr:hypothetical protein [Acidimicrobiia bacterium]MCY4495318.1 hypothetical protein [Acidimicrobiaceae bacterium]
MATIVPHFLTAATLTPICRRGIGVCFAPVGVLVSGEPGAIETAGLVAGDVETLTWAGVFGNLIPVTLGNIVGGVMVGLPSRAVHLRGDGQVDETA